MLSQNTRNSLTWAVSIHSLACRRMGGHGAEMHGGRTYSIRHHPDQQPCIQADRRDGLHQACRRGDQPGKTVETGARAPAERRQNIICVNDSRYGPKGATLATYQN